MKGCIIFISEGEIKGRTSVISLSFRCLLHTKNRQAGEGAGVGGRCLDGPQEDDM